MMPPREGPPMDRHRSRLSRWTFVVGTAGLGITCPNEILLQITEVVQ
jgi:hypothetical protein